jgi:hypothetical protein
MVENYNRFASQVLKDYSGQSRAAMNNDNLHSLPRHLIELRMAHADLNSLIDQAAMDIPQDELAVRRLKKRRLLLRDQIARIEAELDPPEPA